MNQTNDNHGTLSFSVTERGEPKTRSFTLDDTDLKDSATLRTYNVESSDGFILADVTALEIEGAGIKISVSATFRDGSSAGGYNWRVSSREEVGDRLLEFLTRIYMEALQKVENRKLREEREQAAKSSYP